MAVFAIKAVLFDIANVRAGVTQDFADAFLLPSTVKRKNMLVAGHN